MRDVCDDIKRWERCKVLIVGVPTDSQQNEKLASAEAGNVEAEVYKLVTQRLNPSQSSSVIQSERRAVIHASGAGASAPTCGELKY
jgi:hypothetical protein